MAALSPSAAASGTASSSAATAEAASTAAAAKTAAPAVSAETATAFWTACASVAARGTGTASAATACTAAAEAASAVTAAKTAAPIIPTETTSGAMRRLTMVRRWGRGRCSGPPRHEQATPEGTARRHIRRIASSAQTAKKSALLPSLPLRAKHLVYKKQCNNHYNDNREYCVAKPDAVFLRNSLCRKLLGGSGDTAFYGRIFRWGLSIHLIQRLYFFTESSKDLLYTGIIIFAREIRF